MGTTDFWEAAVTWEKKIYQQLGLGLVCYLIDAINISL
jgi:hypothetical protein